MHAKCRFIGGLSALHGLLLVNLIQGEIRSISAFVVLMATMRAALNFAFSQHAL